MARLVTAIFRSKSKAIGAMEDLMRLGYPEEDMSLLMSETTHGREFMVKESTKAPEGMSTGAAVGGVLGAIAAGLTTVGMLAAPGLGIFVVGQWLSILTGFGAGALSGGLIGGLIGLGLPEHEADLYRAEIEKGGILMGVYAVDDESADEIKAVFTQNEAEHIRLEHAKEGISQGRRVA